MGEKFSLILVLVVLVKFFWRLLLWLFFVGIVFFWVWFGILILIFIDFVGDVFIVWGMK